MRQYQEQQKGKVAIAEVVAGVAAGAAAGAAAVALAAGACQQRHASRVAGEKERGHVLVVVFNYC